MSMGNNPLKLQDNLNATLNTLQTRHSEVVLLVCDEINKYEQTISHGVSDSRAEKLAMQAGDELVEHLRNAVQEWKASTEQSSCSIRILRWAAIKDTTYTQVLGTVVDFRDHFQEELRKSSTYYIQSRLQVANLTDRRLANFSQYTLEELPVQLFGVRLGGKQHPILYHPVYCQTHNLTATESKPIYFSPIENVIKAYRDHPVFMEEGRSQAAGAEDAQLIRVFFDKAE